MSDKPMTPGQLAFSAYAQARKQRGEAPSVMDWEDLTPTRKQVFDEVAEAVRKQMLDGLGVDLVFVSEAAAVFEDGCLGQAYPDCKGPIEIVAAMITEKNALRAFKARTEAGLKP